MGIAIGIRDSLYFQRMNFNFFPLFFPGLTFFKPFFPNGWNGFLRTDLEDGAFTTVDGQGLETLMGMIPGPENGISGRMNNRIGPLKKMCSRRF